MRQLYLLYNNTEINQTTYTTYTADYTINAGDVISLYTKREEGESNGYCRYLTVKGALVPKTLPWHVTE